MDVGIEKIISTTLSTPFGSEVLADARMLFEDASRLTLWVLNLRQYGSCDEGDFEKRANVPYVRWKLMDPAIR